MSTSVSLPFILDQSPGKIIPRNVVRIVILESSCRKRSVCALSELSLWLCPWSLTMPPHFSLYSSVSNNVSQRLSLPPDYWPDPSISDCALFIFDGDPISDQPSILWPSFYILYHASSFLTVCPPFLSLPPRFSLCSPCLKMHLSRHVPFSVTNISWELK